MHIQSQTNPAIPRCPQCRAKDVIKKGVRTTRYEARQRWGCNRCGHTFTNLVTKHSPHFECFPLPAVYAKLHE
jgi:transposase-like protein